MPTRSQKIRLGIFIFCGAVALIILLIIIASEQFLKDKDVYFISYKDVSVSGLENGSPVKYLGLGVGSITDIRIDPEDVSRIVITIELVPGTPIKKDARAVISIIGITGLKMIEIRGGSNEAELLKPGQYIRAGSSITEEITGKAEIIAEKIELILNNLNRFSQPENLDKIIRFAESAGETFDNINQLVIENRKNLRESLFAGNSALSRIDTMSFYLLETTEKINKLTLSDTLGQILSNVSEVTMKLKQANLLNLIDQLSEAVRNTNDLLRTIDHDMQRGSIDFLKSMQKMRSALDYLNEASRQINEDPSILIRGTSREDLPDEDLDQ